MKIAVVGAGLFGVTIALRLSEEYDVTLFDRAGDILTAASRINQLRWHKGYHYPRSPETVKSLLSSHESFLSVYPDVVMHDFNHHYCIAKDGSFLSGEQYKQFCVNEGLEFKEVSCHKSLNAGIADITVVVNESLIDFWALRNTCLNKLNKSNVDLRLLTEFDKSDVDGFDFVVNCTYANLNKILHVENQKQYQFEVCEKIIVKPSPNLKNESIVLMDGPFMCFDPLGSTGLSLMGNVVHALHHTNVGRFPVVPDNLKSVLNVGPVRNPPVTAFKEFISSAKPFFNDVEQCEYVASMFTVRTVLPNLEKTDARPTVVTRVTDKVINVFSGKLDTCVIAAKKVEQIIRETSFK